MNIKLKFKTIAIITITKMKKFNSRGAKMLKYFFNLIFKISLKQLTMLLEKSRDVKINDMIPEIPKEKIFVFLEFSTIFRKNTITFSLIFFKDSVNSKMKSM